MDPCQFNLSSRTILEQIDNDTIALVINRKSRIIMADGHKIVEKAEKIRREKPITKVALKSSAPICSKTKVFLEEAGIKILEEQTK
ncbi:MAG: hypothetical protein D6B25_01680 [Desulfobulbaceae bacterium]|nr:MAG: hypothetical protein D6B25_01680 [Desulfobulbaceae bacterium]